MLTVTRRYNLSLLHSIPEDNVGIECSGLHGHDFKLEVTVTKSPDFSSDNVINKNQLDHVVQTEILNPYNNTIINQSFSLGTGEVIAQNFLQKLKSVSDLPFRVVSVQLIETRKNFFKAEYSVLRSEVNYG